MGMLARVHEHRSYRVPPISMKDPALASLFGDSYRTDSGIAVTYETAFTYSAVYDAVNQISSDIAKLPLNLYKRRPDSGADVFDRSPIQRLLKTEPNPEMGSMIFRRQLMVWALTDKGGFAEIQRNGVGQPAALWPIAPDRVTPYRDRLNDGTLGPLYYQIDGGRTKIQPENMLHIGGIGYDPHCAYPIIQKARQAIGLALAAEQFGAAFFGNGASFGGILSTDQNLADDTAGRNAIRAELEQRHQGAGRAHRLAVLWGGLKLQEIGAKPSEAQMNELRSKQIEDVARFFRMPPYRLGLNTPGAVSYSSVEMAQLDYYQGAMLDWVTQIEQEWNRKLIPKLEQNQQFIKHNANAFLRGDIKSRSEALGIMRDKGIINANEWRDLEDMNPQDGDQGNQYLVQSAQIPADRLPKLVDSQIKKNEIPPQPQPQPGHDPSALDAQKTRAEAAERLVGESRAVCEGLQAMLAAAESAGSTSREEIAAIRSELTAAQATSAELALLAGELRRALEQATENHRIATEAAARSDEQRLAAEMRAADAQTKADEAAAAAAAAQDARAAAECAHAEARARIREALAASDAAMASRDAASAEAAAAAQDSVAANEARSQAEAALLSLQAELDRSNGDCGVVTAARDAALIEVQRAVAAAQAAESEQERLSQALAAATEAEAAARQSADRAREQCATVDAALVSMRQAADVAIEEARTARMALEESRTSAAETLSIAQGDLANEQQRSTALQMSLEAANEAVEEANRRLTDAKSEQDTGISTLISAHRDLVVDIMRRMIDRETERIQTRAHLAPDKFTDALEKFYDGHADLCQRSLLPAVKVHLAFVRSADDPVAATASLVRTHIAESRRQVGLAVEDADSPASAMASLFRRWESERVSAIADALMQKEIDYARTH